MTGPKLSIVVSTFNRAKDYLPKCLDSILSQNFMDFEVHVVDDHSQDDTPKLLVKYQNKDARVVYHRFKENFGSDTKPKNYGALKATGQYLMFVDDDVCLRPGALSKLVSMLDENKKLDVVYGDMWIKPMEEPGIARDFDTQYLMLRNFIDTSAAMMRKEAFMYVGGFDETLPKYIDWNLWVRMSKAGFKFKRLEEFTFDYYIHENTKSKRVETQTYLHPALGELFVPTFDPTSCYIHSGAIGKQKKPKVAIFTLHYNRIEYSKQSYKEMSESAGYPFHWFAIDNASQDGTGEWLKTLKDTTYILNERNLGITGASNLALSEIMRRNYDIVIKIDNDIEFLTKDWLKDIVDLWKRNHMLYVSPYVEGLVDNPGGAPRIGFGMIGNEIVEVTTHIGGLFAAVSSKAYQEFRFTDLMLHGDQDMEASQAFRKMGYMPCYLPNHIVVHRDTTAGQKRKYQEYFERRKEEKRTSL